MALLNPDRDKLRGDEIQGDPLTSFDALAPENDQIATYDQNWGFAVTPEQRERANQYKGDLDQSVKKQQAALGSARSQFQSAMAAGDKEGQGILAKARDAAGSIPRGDMDLVPVRVVNGGTVEATYMIPRSSVNTMAADKKSFNGGDGTYTANWVDGGKNFNIDVRIKGTGGKRGKELHESLQDAQGQVQHAQSLMNREYGAAQKAAGMQIGALEKQIASERGIAERSFDQQASQAQAGIDATAKMWPTFLSDMTQRFTKGRETNTGGIRDLLDSGALVAKGAVK